MYECTVWLPSPKLARFIHLEATGDLADWFVGKRWLRPRLRRVVLANGCHCAGLSHAPKHASSNIGTGFG